MDTWVISNLNNELLRDAVASERVLARSNHLVTTTTRMRMRVD